MCCAIAADLKFDSARTQGGGGRIYLVEHDAAKLPYQPHCTLKTAVAIGATTLSAYLATTGVFGASGSLDIDIFGSGVETKAFSALSTNNFTNTATAGAHAARSILKLTNASDYATTDWKCVGALGGTNLRKNGSDTEVFDETGALLATLKGNRSIELAPTLLQVSKAELDFFFKEAEDKLYAAKYVIPAATLGSIIIVAKRVQVVSNPDVRFEANNPRQLSYQLKVIQEDGFDAFMVYEG